MSLKSFLCTMVIFCGGYASNTLLDEVLDTREIFSRPDLRLQNRFQGLHHLQPREAEDTERFGRVAGRVRRTTPEDWNAPWKSAGRRRQKAAGMSHPCRMELPGRFGNPWNVRGIVAT